jgi:hypothetical protein
VFCLAFPVIPKPFLKNWRNQVIDRRIVIAYQDGGTFGRKLIHQIVRHNNRGGMTLLETLNMGIEVMYVEITVSSYYDKGAYAGIFEVRAHRQEVNIFLTEDLTQCPDVRGKEGANLKIVYDI